MMDLMTELEKVKKAQIQLRILTSEQKNQFLEDLSNNLLKAEDQILAANGRDLEAYQKSPGFQQAFLDRLRLNKDRLFQMVQSLKEVSALPDPVGEVQETKYLPNGLVLKKVRSPLGVIFLIYEARPNVIGEAFALAFKAGNALVLKGGKESDQTSQVIYEVIRQSLVAGNLPSHLFWGLIGASREVTDFLMQQNKLIDVLIPRGGDKLIEHVTRTSRIPIIKNDRGLCHIYVHSEASFEMALSILDNAKTQRPSVCNAAETLLVDRAIASTFLPLAYERLHSKGVEFFLCEDSVKILNGKNGVHLADQSQFDREYLDLKISLKIVEGMDEALDHIQRHGSSHSEAIITENSKVARRFQTMVDAAVVYWNASTRFTDGGQFGMGAEIGISTQKLHVRGPVGIESLTSQRWIVDGVGQIRP